MSESSESSSDECRCGFDRRQLERQIRELTEKLEYSQLQVSILRAERKQMRKDLHETEFKGRSSMRPFSAPYLPDEVLRYIFSLATHFEGLALPLWHDLPDFRWSAATLARRTIPLVCRRWYNIGLEFIYQHIALRRSLQTEQLLTTLKHLGRGVRKLRTGWVQGLEFQINNAFGISFENVALTAIRLLGVLPEGKLRKFAVVGGDCAFKRGNTTGLLVNAMLDKSGPLLEMVHLPCVQYSAHLSERSQINVGNLTLTGGWSFRGNESVGKGPILRTSIWDECKCTDFTNLHIRVSDYSCAGFVTTLSIVTHTIDEHYESFFAFLDAATRLDTIHVVSRNNDSMITRYLDEFLERIPRVTRLLITLETSCDNVAEVNDQICHRGIEEIQVYMRQWQAYHSICALSALILKVQSGNLPSLRRLVINGEFPDGCLDSARILPRNERERWQTAIRACEQWGVEMASHQGHPIHLWNDRHSLGLNVTSESNTTSSVDEDSDEWYERYDSNSTNGLPSSDSEESVVSDDQDDRPYQFVYQPDVEQVGSDLEASSNSSNEGSDDDSE